MNKRYKICIIGLGYVGLPLAIEFGKKYKTVGFDIDSERIKQLNNYTDKTLEVSSNDLKYVIINKKSKYDENGLFLTDKKDDISDCNFFIVTVPTPTDKFNNPILNPLLEASKTIGKFLKKNDIVVYESTVYPGVTEDECVPVLELFSKLKLNKDFFVGYSPERINPGDKQKTITKIVKVTSGSDKKSANEINKLYKSIISAGTHLAPSIKVAEAAKVIENSQRDINIAFMNELSKIFNLMDINTLDVLEAAGTKWNFLPFKPGLVGGHCIGVDPYYLAQKAKELGYHPEIILSGRKMNDSMGNYIGSEFIKLMVSKDKKIKGSSVLIMGITFKENCPDIRNTKVVDIIKYLQSFQIKLKIYDPWADTFEAKNEYGLKCVNTLPNEKFDGILVCVAHDEYKKINIENLMKKNCALYDVKGIIRSKSHKSL